MKTTNPTATVQAQPENAHYPLKIWQTTVNGQSVTVSVWPDKKIRTGYFEKDFWSTLKREGLSLTDEEWTASPGPDWRDITDNELASYATPCKADMDNINAFAKRTELPAYKVIYADGSSYVTSMSKTTTLDKARTYFIGASIEQPDGTCKAVTDVQPA